MPGMQVALASQTGITSITTVLVPLPDLPAMVVRIWAVQFDLTSWTEATAVAQVLHHNVGTSALSVADFRSMWTRVSQAVGTDAMTHVSVPFWPEPYELIGTQRWDTQPSAGTISATLQIHYTLRRETNATLWNLLKVKTSFEGD